MIRILAIIPARKGSKGIPGKNLAVIDGKPLIQYSIEAALTSKHLSAICVSSDDPGIMALANTFENVYAHNRSSDIAMDASPVSETISAVLEDMDASFDAIILLQPTAPIRTGKQIDDAIELLLANQSANSVISVCSMNDVHPARMYWKEEAGLVPIIKEFEHTRRQDIPPAYYRNGSIYIVRTKVFLETGIIMAKPSIGFEMPYSQLLNIDEPRDLLIADPLVKAWKNGHL